MGSRSKTETAAVLAAIAESCPDSVAGVACEGTALECRTYSLRKKAFLFLRTVDCRFKLDASRAEAVRMSVEDPAHYGIGANGWATVKFGEGHQPNRRLIAKWVRESYDLMAGGPAGAASVRKRS